MNGKQILSVVGMALILAAGNAVAQDDGALDDVTMRLMELRDEAPDAVIKTIALPANVDVDSEAVAASESGLNTANTARERRVAGLQMALDSIADAQNAANEAAENSSRADDNIPDNAQVPGDPGRP